MKDKIWLVNPTTKRLESAYGLQPYSKQIQTAQPFSVSLKTVMVADDLDGWPRGDNDLLLTTSASLGESPLVQRVHYYDEEIPAGTILKDFYAQTMFVCADYSGTDQLYLNIKILEINTDVNDRDALVNSFSKVAVTAGSVFPIAMPYAVLASGLASAIEKLISALEKDVSVIDVPIILYPPDRPDAGIPLQTGLFVVFSQEVDGTEYQVEPNHTLKRVDGKELNVAYALFIIEAGQFISPSWVTSQKVATLLTQIEIGNDKTASGSIDFLNNTLEQYSNFKDLRRYAELKSKDSAKLTNDEKQLMEKISKKTDLIPFLPK